MNTKQDARKLDLMGKEDLRRRTVRAVIKQGMSKAEAARVFGVSRTSVHLWLDLYQQNGEEGLVPGASRQTEVRRTACRLAGGGDCEPYQRPLSRATEDAVCVVHARGCS